MSNVSYTVKNIFLVESSFKRNPTVSKAEHSSNTFNITIEPINTDNDIFNIGLEVEFHSKAKDSEVEENEIDLTVKMIGVFIKEGDIDVIPSDYFINVNAAAIIFPFVREHISSITAKSGIEAVFLPPINFVEIYNQKLKELESETK
jgi:preprotein translocase subunit SecB